MTRRSNGFDPHRRSGHFTSRRGLLIAAGAAVGTLGLPAPLRAGPECEVIDARVNIALGRLFTKVGWAREVANRAHAILMMPRVIKGSFILGGAYGKGALRLNDSTGRYERSDAYYEVAEGSIGLQIGIQKTGHALFFMTRSALDGFRAADGWEIGVDAEVTFPPTGLTAGLDSTTLQKPIIGVVFDQNGLAIGASLKGAKYTRIAC